MISSLTCYASKEKRRSDSVLQTKVTSLEREKRREEKRGRENYLKTLSSLLLP
jgi:hypothetical protein